MKKIVIENSNLVESYEIDYIAKQSNGSVLYRAGGTAILATVTTDTNSPVNEDFLPLTVQYIEKSYATGKIPGGFVKRESKPSDFETLTSRIIDRSIRPLFPKGYQYPTVITVMVLSANRDVDLQCAALNAASAALYISDIPIKKAIRAIRIGRLDEEFVLNPTPTELDKSELDLFVSGVDDELLMIEMRVLGSNKSTKEIPIGVDVFGATPSIAELGLNYSSNELDEEKLLEALKFASTSIKSSSEELAARLQDFCKDEFEIELKEDGLKSEIVDYVDNNLIADIKSSIARMAKSERDGELKRIAKNLSKSDIAIENSWSFEEILKSIENKKREIVRSEIVDNNIRPDGRSPKEIRDIDIEVNILPNAHSSVLFTRGQTQALVVGTIGGDMDAQMFELLTDKGSSKEKFMLHYNFPGFSVGEASTIGPPGRRELGHGNLAKRAVESTIEPSFSQTIRVVSEILESNGSSSMATVCGTSLALKAASIPTTSLVAGVAMGLVSEGGKYAILTDIAGIEDHDGDMDFKIAGSKEGITAMQMDIKLGGLDFNILQEALMQAKEARLSILEKMEEAEKGIVLSEHLPTTHAFSINPGKIVDIIGQAGKTIKEIIEKFEVSIDLDRDNGEVKISGANKKKVEAAKDHIIDIAGKEDNYKKPSELYNVGDKFTGKVKKIVDFGAFVELPKGGDGLLHISKLSKQRVSKVSDIVNEGEELEVEILSINKNKVELALAEKE